MGSIGKVLIILGIGLALVGVGLYFAERWGLPVGRLPGDVRIERGNFSLYFPLATMILLSILLTVGINVILRLINRK